MSGQHIRQKFSSLWLEPWLFYSLLIVNLLPIWSARYFPSQDGVGHVENAVILRHWLGPSGDFYRQYYRINPFPEPNWLGHVMLMFLTAILSPRNSLKAILSIFILAFPSALRYAAGGIRRGGEAAAYLALPFIYGLPLQKGNLNFCFGFVLFFVVVGFWIRHRDRLGAAVVAAFIGLTLLLYFSHIVSLIMAIMVIGCVEIGFAIRDRSLAKSRIIKAAIAFAPAVVLTAAFFLSRGSGQVDRLSPKVLIEQLIQLQALLSYSQAEAHLAIAVACIFAVAVIFTIARMRGGLIIYDSLAAAVIVALVLYFLVPNSAAGGGLISFRLAMFVYFVLMLWLAARPIRWAPIGIAALIAISMGFVALNYRTAARVSAYVTDFTSIAPHVRRGSTLLPVLASWKEYSPNGRPFTYRIRPMLLAAGYVAAERGVIDLGNYEASQGYFPLLWKDPNHPPLADYIVVWRTGPIDKDSRLIPMQSLIETKYQLAFISRHG
ncbi:MAG TPA: hypothetical protein VGF52_07355 [Tepidisphaeraceae bacterium]